MLRTLKNINWYIKTKTKTSGQSFSEEALTWREDDPIKYYNHKIVCDSSEASLIVLNKHDFHTISNKIMIKEHKRLCQKILDLPQFQNFTMPQMRRMTHTAKENLYNRSQKVVE